MSRRRLFWGVVIVLFGLLLLLQNFGLLPVNAWAIFWPLLIILLGVWLLLRRDEVRMHEVRLPAEGVRKASLRLEHGAGVLKLGALGGSEDLLLARCWGDVNLDQERHEDTIALRLRVAAESFFLPFMASPEGHRWEILLSPQVPFDLDLRLGANDAHLDLRDLQVPTLHLETGASNTHLTLPMQGQTQAQVKSGVASLKIQIPEGVAARIHVQSGLAGVSVAPRFPFNGRTYESPDFETAIHRAEIHLETGLGAVEIF
jgi:hypothetical protein